MRYIADSDGYVKEVSFGADIVCDGQECTEYTGAVPTGYASLEAWFMEELERLYRWKIVGGELTLDSTAVAPYDPGPLCIAEAWANPDLSEPFGPQKIELAIPDGAAVLVKFAKEPDAVSWKETHLCFKNDVTNVSMLYYAGIMRRNVTVSSTGVEFTSCVRQLEYLNATNTDERDDRMVPAVIYIVKGIRALGAYTGGGIITQLTATHDGAGNVTVHSATATHDGAGNVTIR